MPLTASQHKMARAAFELAISRYKRKQPSRAAMQYAQADALLETSYGLGWKGAMVGSHNWGAVQCVAGQAPCIAYTDSFPDGTTYSYTYGGTSHINRTTALNGYAGYPVYYVDWLTTKTRIHRGGWIGSGSNSGADEFSWNVLDRSY